MGKRLLIRPGAIGDCLLAFPAMQSLRAGYTEVWVPGAIVPLVRFADRVANLASTGIELFGVGDLPPDPQLLHRLREFDSIVSWYGANRDDFRAAAASCELPFEFFPALPPPSYHEHAGDFFAAQAGAARGLAPSLPIADLTHRDSVVMHPFSGGVRKNWPIEKFQELARQCPLPVEWLAGPEEPLAAAHRFDDLWELAQWIAGARVFVGNDSGITHLAAAVGVPVIAIFGPTDPNVWGPRGGSVTLMRSEPIGDLRVSAILQGVRRVLKCA